MTINLKSLNDLRAAAGQKPLKAWKESKAKLEAAIAKLQAGTTVKQQLKASVPTKTVTLVEIAADADRDVKVVRAKFRRLYEDGGKGLPQPVGDGWEFASKDASKVRELLLSDRRRSA